MSKNTELATNIIQLVGGKHNISNVFHCMTRLRLNLKDEGLANLPEIEKVKGVLGIAVIEGEIQIIIGPGVSSLYDEVIKITGHKKTEQIGVNLDETKKDYSLKGVFNSIVKAFSASTNPLVNAFIVIGLFNVISALIGPSFFNLVTTDSDLYKNFYNVGQGIIYFLPFFFAVTASKHFNANTYISMILATILLYPETATLLSSEAGYTVFGIPAMAVTYSSSVLPIIMIVWIQSYVERFAKKFVPDMLKALIVPLITILIMMPLGLCAIGPIGTIIGNTLANLVIGLYQVAGPVETMLVAALIPFLISFGIANPIFFICLSMLFANGVEYTFLPFATVIANFIAMGVSLGFMLKTKKAENKQLALTCFASVFMGGVSEPTWFGILIPNKGLYLPAMIGGALAGLYIGIMRVGYYQFGPSNVLSVLGYMSPAGGSNFMHGCIAAGIAAIATTILIFIFYKEEKDI